VSTPTVRIRIVPYGDPLFDPHASLEMRPGDGGGGVPAYATVGVAEDNRGALGVVEACDIQDLGLGHVHVGDTTHLDAVDWEGHRVAATPSGGWRAAL
jgi:hypothetical protein